MNEPVPVSEALALAALAALAPDALAVAVPAVSVGLRAFLRLSASQVQLFRDCQRKWSWRYIAGIEEPPNAAAALGGDTHTQLETYLLGGDLDFTVEAGYIAASGLEHLPKPGTPGMQVEQEFHFLGPSGHSYLGYKDVELPPVEGKPGVVIDHKTTSNFRWQKTAEVLLTDVQATLYAVDYFRKYPNEKEVELRWVYYLTRGSKKSAVTRHSNGWPVLMSHEQAWGNFISIEQTAEEMAVAATKEPLELPANTNHCDAFGGCPHQGRCNLSPFDKLRSYVNQNALLAKLGQIQGANGAPPPQVPAGTNTPGMPAMMPGMPMMMPPGALPVTTNTLLAPPVMPGAPPTTTNTLLARIQAGGAPAATPIAPHAPAPLALALVPPVAPQAPMNPPEWQPPPAPAAPVSAPLPAEAVPAATGLPAWAHSPVPYGGPAPALPPVQRVAPGEAIPNPMMFMPGGVAPAAPSAGQAPVFMQPAVPPNASAAIIAQPSAVPPGAMVPPGAVGPASLPAAPAAPAAPTGRRGRPRKEAAPAAPAPLPPAVERAMPPVLKDLAGFTAAYPGHNPNLLTPEQVQWLNAQYDAAHPAAPVASGVLAAGAGGELGQLTAAVQGAGVRVTQETMSREAVAAGQRALLAGQQNPFADKAPSVGGESAPIGVLYLNCGPVDGNVVDANAFIVAAKKRVTQTQIDDGKGNKLYVSDYRFAPFGQGPGMLSLAIGAEIDALVQNPELAQAVARVGVRLNTNTPEGAAVEVELTSRARLVVR